MGNTVIRVDNLSKRYIIGHQSQDRYQTLRDQIASGAKRLGKRLLHPLKASSGQPLLGVDESEEFWALKDISLEVTQGDRIGIIGRNGAGKSTLLKILSRITEPTKGRALIKGRVSSLLEVGTGFHPELTGRENIFLNGAILGMDRQEIKNKFDEIVAFAEIEKFLDTPVKRYSSGMYVRLAFAVAAHLEPEILIVDEVLAVGDAEFQKKCIGKMQKVGKEGRTVLFVSHNMSAIAGLCSNAICLDHGQMTYDGEVQNAINKYLISEKTHKSSEDLTQKKNRVGSLNFSRLLRLTLKNKANQKVSTFKMFDPMSVEIKFLLNEDIQNLEIGFSITTLLNESIAGYVSTWEGMKSNFKKGEHLISCNIPCVNLLPNNYYLTVWIKKIGEKVDEQINNAISFNVIGQDVTGHVPYFERYSHLKTFSRSTWSAH